MNVNKSITYEHCRGTHLIHKRFPTICEKLSKMLINFPLSYAYNYNTDN